MSGGGPADLSSKLDELYAHRFSAAEQASRATVWQVLCTAFFSRYVSPDATVLDVGAGYCDFINQIEAGRKIAIDLNPDVRRHAALGIEVHLAPLTELGAHVANESVDVAFASNVFEHMRSPDDLLAALRAVRSTLRIGGSLIIMQPNIRAVGGAFWDFFDHTLPLTEKGMAEALSVTGFEIQELRARFLPYTTKSRLPQSPWLIRLYLMCPPAQRLLGKQMLVIARRPGP